MSRKQYSITFLGKGEAFPSATAVLGVFLPHSQMTSVTAKPERGALSYVTGAVSDIKSCIGDAEL